MGGSKFSAVESTQVERQVGELASHPPPRDEVEGP